MDKILCYLLCFIITISCEKKIENNEIPSFENLVWGDEFNYNGKINDSLWHNQTIPINNGSWANNELQHYTDNLENCFVKNGILHIVAIKEDAKDFNMTKQILKLEPDIKIIIAGRKKTLLDGNFTLRFIIVLKVQLY